MVRQVNTEPGNKGGGWSGDPAELTCASGPRWVLLPARYFMVSNLWDSNIVFKPATSVSIFMLVWVKWQSCSALWNTHTRAHTISRAHSFKGSVLLSINTNHFHEFSLRLSKHLFMLCFLETRYKHKSRWAHTNLGSGQRHNQSWKSFVLPKAVMRWSTYQLFYATFLQVHVQESIGANFTHHVLQHRHLRTNKELISNNSIHRHLQPAESWASESGSWTSADRWASLKPFDGRNE